MGMLLRRHDRTADKNPKVNGKPVKQEPKKNLAQNQNTDGRARLARYR